MSASDIERLRALLVDQKAAAASAMELLDACAPRTSVEDDLFGPDDESARGAEAERASALPRTRRDRPRGPSVVDGDLAGVRGPRCSLEPSPAPAPSADPVPDASARPLGSRNERPPTSVAGGPGASAPVPAPAPAPAPKGSLFGDDDEDDDDGGLFGAPVPASRAPAPSADSFAPPGAPFAAPALSPASSPADHLDAVAAEPEAPAKPRTMMGLGPLMGGLSLGELKQRIGSRGSAPAPPDVDGGEDRAAEPGEPPAGPGVGEGPNVVVVPMVAPLVASGGKPAWMVELAAKKKAKAAAEAAAEAAAAAARGGGTSRGRGVTPRPE